MMSKIEKSMKEKQTWTTWEELLLTCAVKRHGLQDWDSIAMELQSRSSFPIPLTAQTCRNKYHDLKRRFTDYTNGVAPSGDEVDDDGNSVPWLEELRKVRVAELKQEVHRHDLSIQTLELKVKRLEEEREQSIRENQNEDQKPDLEKNLEEERSESDKNDITREPADYVAGVSVSGERSERDNRSFNESNSTENRQTGEKDDERELEAVQTGSVKPDSESKPGREDSWNDSSKLSEEKKADDESADLRDSAAAESKEGTKESSDVQSSASLTKKSGGGDEPVVSPATMRRDSAKSEPLVRILDIVRSHKHGSMFESRLDSQKTENYKNIVRQHVDLETVQTRMEDGSYSCATKFYLDLLLLFNNAIVFYSKASAESVAAFELRNLVLKELKKKRIGRQSNLSPEAGPILLQPKPDPERPDSLIAKHKSSAPFIVCRKRSSMSAKPSTSNKAEKQAADEKPVINSKPPVKSSSTSPNEEDSSVKLKLKEKPVTGVRSMRRSGNGRTNSTTTTSKALVSNSSTNPAGSTNKGEAPKVEKKKTEVPNTVKKRGAADFLKRIKKNSPVKGMLLETLKSSPEDNGSSRRDQSKKRVDERKEVTRQKGGVASGGAGGKQVKEENSPSKRAVGRPPKRGREAAPVKRGREGGEVEVAAKRPKKGTRRY